MVPRLGQFIENLCKKEIYKHSWQILFTPDYLSLFLSLQLLETTNILRSFYK